MGPSLAKSKGYSSFNACTKYRARDREVGFKTRFHVRDYITGVRIMLSCIDPSPIAAD